ncbi:MAG: hypothetical protein KAI47_06050, partial [Deltaproteobacteria bacterium]|nr:hypothetical protein [Deltaproteobacteria bacterium]
SSCDDGDACTADSLAGSGPACTAFCQHTAITSCQGGDGCCPAGCSFAGDSDCAAPPSDLGTSRDLGTSAPDSKPMRDTGSSSTLDRGAPPVDVVALGQDQRTVTPPGSGALEGGCRLSGEASQTPSVDGTLSVVLALFGFLALHRRGQARGSKHRK